MKLCTTGIPLKALFNDVPQCKNLISTSSTFPESRLLFPQLVNGCRFDPLEENSSENLAWDGEECDAMPVIADL